jgi:tetratricopeptide (TPR) repeat protein
MFTCRACTCRALSTLLDTPIYLSASLATLSKRASPSHTSTIRTYGTKRFVAESEKENIRKVQRALKPTEHALRKRAEWLDDPYKIGKEMERLLALDKFIEAAAFAKVASQKYKVTVAWNHLIDYQMKNLKLHAAIKSYNEMKKRAQAPNAQTYTIIFRGCAISPHPKLAVTEAVKLYNNMLANDRITPNIIHLNAVLKVCTKAGDLDTLFTIAKTADDKLRAPNNLTYTTILNALRQPIEKPHSDKLVTLERISKVQQTIQRAQGIWEEVVKKWRDASIFIDEELVCAMGRNLLTGDYNDNNAVFSLVEQTMGIPKEPEQLSGLAWRAVKGTGESFAGDGGDSPKSIENGSALVKSKESNGSSGQLATPGNNALSMVMAAIERTGRTNLARRYWIIFTKNFHVVPDANSWHSLLRALRRGKSSTKTAEYITEMPKDMMSVKTFRVAMRTCMRDNLNKSSFDNATKVLEAMVTSLPVPDALVLRIYLRVAYANRRPFDEKYKQKDSTGADFAWARQMCTALENLWEPYEIVAKQFTNDGFGPNLGKKFDVEKEREVWVQEAGGRAELAALARKMVAAYDRLISDQLVPPAVSKRFAPRRNALNRFVMKYFEDKDKFEPEWNGERAEKKERTSKTSSKLR